MTEGSPPKPMGLSVLLKGYPFPSEDAAPKRAVSDSGAHEPVVNLGNAEKFLEALAGVEPVTFQTFDDKGKDKSLIRIIHGTLAESAEDLASLNRRGAGIYVMVNEGDGKGRKEANVVSVRAVLLDLDGSLLEPVSEWTLPQAKGEIVEKSSFSLIKDNFYQLTEGWREK